MELRGIYYLRGSFKKSCGFCGFRIFVRGWLDWAFPRFVADCHCVNRPSFFAGKKVSRRPSRPPNTPRGRHRAGRGRTERRRPRKRCPTGLLTDPRGRVRQLAARARAMQTGCIDLLAVKRPKPPSSRSRPTGMCAHPFVPGGSD